MVINQLKSRKKNIENLLTMNMMTKKIHGKFN